ncbi:MAG TPA: glycosyltransferase [Casimicrobiaceae bacterium]|nr:glycosyltransferase [Casimicrobiaceae bacterium]
MKPFSIVIPSWNNLRYLRLCVDSLRRHSTRPHQIIVHVNAGDDGTRDWVERERIDHTASDENVGICYALNRAALLARTDYVMYANDDMVAAPGWDVALDAALARVARHRLFMLSGTMVEPEATGNACVVVADLGRDPERFDLGGFARQAPALVRGDWLGATWPPTLVTRAAWHEIGGYSVEFSPGMGSDNDFAMKLWHAGCRVFVGVGSSLFYHFAKVSTARIRKNDGGRQFLMKWGIAQSAFDRRWLRRGQAVPPGETGVVVAEPRPSPGLALDRIRSALKRRIG